MTYVGDIEMRGFVGSLLRRVHSHREDRGLNKMMKGKFSSYEEMGIWNRYGMTHVEFNSFEEGCLERASYRYSNYVVLMDLIFCIKALYKKNIADWYFYTEFYSGIIRKKFKI